MSSDSYIVRGYGHRNSIYDQVRIIGYIDLKFINYLCCHFKMTNTNEDNVFLYEKTLLNTIIKNTKETKVIKYFIYYDGLVLCYCVMYTLIYT